MIASSTIELSTPCTPTQKGTTLIPATLFPPEIPEIPRELFDFAPKIPVTIVPCLLLVKHYLYLKHNSKPIAH